MNYLDSMFMSCITSFGTCYITHYIPHLCYITLYTPPLCYIAKVVHNKNVCYTTHPSLPDAILWFLQVQVNAITQAILSLTELSQVLFIVYLKTQNMDSRFIYIPFVSETVVESK